MKSSKKRLIPSSLSALLLVTLSLPVLPAIANNVKSSTSAPIAQNSRSRIRLQLPNRGAPGSRFGGAARGGCQLDKKPLAALLPKSNLGLTIAAQPSVFLFVPKTSATQGEFILTGPTGQEIYKTSVPLSGQAGVISVDLPPQRIASALQAGKTYQWSFSVICDAADPSANTFVTGAIERMAPDPTLTEQLATAQLYERAMIYADQGLWYETLASLAELRRMYPNDAQLQEEWSAILKSQGLDFIAGEPLAQPIVSNR